MGYDPHMLVLSNQPMAGTATTGLRDWVYTDTGGEASSVYVAAGYFTDAYDRGVRIRDHIRIRELPTGRILDGQFTVAQDTGATQGTVVLDTD